MYFVKQDVINKSGWFQLNTAERGVYSELHNDLLHMVNNVSSFAVNFFNIFQRTKHISMVHILHNLKIEPLKAH